MGFFSSLAKIGSAVLKSPLGGVVKSATKAIPGVGLAVAGYEIASAGMDLLGGGGSGSSSSAPMLPMQNMPMPSMGRGGGAGVPMIPAGGASVGMGNRSIFRNDPNVIAALKPYAIPMRDLRAYYRAPKGFVIVHDQAGDPFGLPKQLARAYGLWKPSAKPPISATDWKAFKRAASVSKKLNKIHSQGQKYLTKKSSSRRAVPANYTIVESGKGSVKVGGRR